MEIMRGLSVVGVGRPVRVPTRLNRTQRSVSAKRLRDLDIGDAARVGPTQTPSNGPSVRIGARRVTHVLCHGLSIPRGPLLVSLA